jgi:hypothetical protein
LGLRILLAHLCMFSSVWLNNVIALQPQISETLSVN